MGEEARKWVLEWHGGNAGQWRDRHGDLRTDTDFPGIGFNLILNMVQFSAFKSWRTLEYDMIEQNQPQRSMAIDFTIALVPEVTTLIAPILHTKIVQGS